MTEIAPAANVTASTAPPANVAEAHARREAIIADKEIGAKYRSGDVATVAEMRALNSFISGQTPDDRLDAAIAGTHTPGMIETTVSGEGLASAMTSSQLASFANDLRADGFSDQIVRDVLNQVPLTAERQREARQLMTRLENDREWVRRYRNKEHAYVDQFRRIHLVLGQPVETK
jgi:hypothetical protein